MYHIIEPQTPKEFEAYFLVRWQTLRAPWNMPPGSEKDDLEHTSLHAMCIEIATHTVCGVARAHLLNNNEAQIRYMGVLETHRKHKIGAQLLHYLENKLQQKGVKKIILQARENALGFYLKNKYENKGKSYLLWDTIQHYLMEKSI